jgi:hypothetical protein
MKQIDPWADLPLSLWTPLQQFEIIKRCRGTPGFATISGWHDGRKATASSCSGPTWRVILIVPRRSRSSTYGTCSHSALPVILYSLHRYRRSQSPFEEIRLSEAIPPCTPRSRWTASSRKTNPRWTKTTNLTTDSPPSTASSQSKASRIAHFKSKT